MTRLMQPLTGAGTIRVMALWALPQLVRQLGLDLTSLMAAEGLASDALDDPDATMSYLALCRLAQRCADQAGVEHFGLMIGSENHLPNLGMIGHLAQNAPSVGEGLADIEQYFAAHDRGADLRVSVDGPSVTVAYVIRRPDATGAQQVADGAMASAINIIRDLCGPRWAPSIVMLPRRPPADVGPYQRILGPRIQFDSELPAVIFPAEWLAAHVPDANSTLRAFFQRLVRRTMPEPETIGEQVRSLIRLRLLEGEPRVESVARVLGLHRRSLSRRLHAEGLSFRDLVQEVRFELAKQLIRDTDLPLARIALLLRYSDATAFSRAFKQWNGSAPALSRLERTGGAA